MSGAIFFTLSNSESAVTFVAIGAPLTSHYTDISWSPLLAQDTAIPAMRQTVKIRRTCWSFYRNIAGSTTTWIGYTLSMGNSPNLACS